MAISETATVNDSVAITGIFPPRPPIGGIVLPCQGVAQEIEVLEIERAGLQADLVDAPPYAQRLIRLEIDKINMELSQLRTKFQQCLPDLVARPPTLQLDHAQKKLWVAAIIANQGGSACDRAFKVAIGIQVEELYIECIVDVSTSIPAGGEIITPYCEAPLRYRDQDPGACYTFYVLADVEYTVQESNKGNNSYQSLSCWWTMSPDAARQPTPLVLDFSKEPEGVK